MNTDYTKRKHHYFHDSLISINRDISWMYFNHRILEEARRENVPVLERMSFLGIYSNNLDEFFRVRVASLSRMIEYGSKSGGHNEINQARQTLKSINRLNNQYSQEYQLAIDEVTLALGNEGIHIVDELSATESQRLFARQYYRENLMGRVSPIWAGNIKHFDNEADDTIYFIVNATKGSHKSKYAILPLPVAQTGRWVRLPDGEDGDHNIMYLDDVVRLCLDMIFPGMDFDQFEAYSFKFTRDAEMEMENEIGNGFMQKIAKGVSSRKQGAPLRLVYDEHMSEGMLRRIKSNLSVSGKQLVPVRAGKYQNHRDFMKFPDCGCSNLKYPKWKPIVDVELHGKQSLFELVRQRDRYLHVPYHSFDGYLRLLNEAAINPRVKSIKTTIYRLAKDSKVIRALVNAAKNGKKVTVVIELMARFDEASNIEWSRKMQEAGIEVILGIEGLKIHSKLTLVDFSSEPSIACISTGNFHEGNASAYTDVLMMTANRNLTSDVAKVFKFIEKPYSQPKFHYLLVSPNDMKKKFLALIEHEIGNHLMGKPSGIKIKINHVTDPDMVAKIYEAAQVGVKVEMLVRGNCALVDQPCLGGNLTVIGIIDRYLEHSRIFCFCNGGDERVFIGSADWMPRNLDNRIEVVTPVYDSEIKAECRRIVDYGLRDTCQGRNVVGPRNNDAEPFRSQEALHDYYLSITENQQHPNNGEEES